MTTRLSTLLVVLGGVSALAACTSSPSPVIPSSANSQPQLPSLSQAAHADNSGIRHLSVTGPRGAYVSTGQPDAGLATIYSNLGTGTTVYDCCNAWSIIGPDVPPPIGPEQWIAVAFTPTAAHTVTQIKVALSWTSGPNGGVVQLAADNSGIPGTVLASKVIKSGIPSFGTCCVLQVLYPKAPVALAANTQYWVVVRTFEATETTIDGWQNDTTSASGPLDVNVGHGWLQAGIQSQIPAFGVFGH